MANYFFETMTQAQASTFQFATDHIVFSSGPASQATVLFNPLTFGSLPTITIVYGGNSLIFADDPSSVRGQSFTLFPDGSKLFIGTTGDDLAVHGTSGSDGLFGSSGNDVMDGGAGGNDLLQGNQGNDMLTGGTGGLNTIFGGQGDDSIILTGSGSSVSATNFAQGNLGNDTFQFAVGDSPGTGGGGAVTTITDWNSTDSLKFGALGPGTGVFHADALSASNFSAAISVADTQIATTHVGDKYAAVQVGSDVVIFADTTGAGHITSADDAIILTGRTLADVLATDFI